MKEYEKPVFEEFRQFANVVETWAIYDSIVICSQFFGSEQNVSGWYTSFASFGQRETHTMFKTRTEATAGQQYCNQKSSDTTDFAYKIHSWGLEITGPPTPECQPFETEPGFVVSAYDAILPQWFKADFPRHCGLQLKIQQDIRCELPALAAPPGYGAIGGGVAFGHTDDPTPEHGDIPFMTNSTISGEPLLRNRFPFPEPLGVPRTGSLEGILYLSEWARNILTNITGPHQIVMNSDLGVPNYNFFPARYVIRLSLFGERLVQQRAQYHR